MFLPIFGLEWHFFLPDNVFSVSLVYHGTMGKISSPDSKKQPPVDQSSDFLYTTVHLVAEFIVKLRG